MDVPLKGVLKYLRIAVVFAGTLGIVQSTIWIILTIFGLVIHYDCEHLLDSSNSGTSALALRTYYFIDEKCKAGLGMDAIRVLVNTLWPYQIFVWECILLVLHVIWLFVSVLLIQRVKESNLQKSIWFIHGWVYFTIGVCAVNIALGSLFGRDVQSFTTGLDKLTPTSPKEMALLPIMVILRSWSATMMTIVMQGFLLLIIDIAVSIYLLVCIFEIHKVTNENDKDNGNTHHTREPIRAFDPNIEARSSQWLAGAEAMERPHVYEPNPTSNVYSRSLQGESNPAYMNSNTNINRYPEQQKTAGIMKRPAKPLPPPWERSNPRPGEMNTPAPDYSPPSSTRFKPNQYAQPYTNYRR